MLVADYAIYRDGLTSYISKHPALLIISIKTSVYGRHLKIYPWIIKLAHKLLIINSVQV